MNASYHARRRRKIERKMDELAEMVAEGYSVSAAARAMGVTQQHGSQLWTRIRAGLNVPAKD